MRRLLFYVFIGYAATVGIGLRMAHALPVHLREMPIKDDILADRFISPAQAAAVARAVTNGRVLAVHLVGVGPKALYRVRMLVGGQIHVVRVGAHDGRVLR